MSLLEEAALDGVPAICIDPKGDLGNLLLGFPDFDPAKFTEWVDPAAAQRKGLSVEEMGSKMAELWKNGLADWEQSGERVQRYQRFGRAADLHARRESRTADDRAEEL